jgi:hypothetical protein
VGVEVGSADAEQLRELVLERSLLGILSLRAPLA